MEADVPREVGGYRLLGPLGQGGMGAVYRALDADGREVALKLLHPHLGADVDARARLQCEVANLQRVRHPGVARVLDAEIDSSEAFVVTELVDGLDLVEHVHRNGPLEPAALAGLAADLREALAVVHAAGVLHRDLTPGNVMLTDSGPVLIDFGIAQGIEDARVTSAGLVAGTPGYVAPELLDGEEPSEQSDWWGWAALVAYAAMGRPPFGTGPARAVLSRTRSGDVVLTGLDPRTEAALRSALAVEPWQRLAPDDVVVELGLVASGDVTPMRTAPVTGGRTRADDTAILHEPYRDPGPQTGVLPEWSPFAGEGGPEDEPWGVEPDDAVDDGEPPRRTGTALAVGLALLALGATRPGVALAIAAALAVLVRSVGLDVAGLRRRWARRGARSGDTAGAVLTWPWYLARAVLGVVPSALLAASAVVLAGGVGWWLLGGDRVVIAPPGEGEAAGALGGNAPWVTTALIAVVVAIGLLTLWFGPMSRATRTGARWVFAGPTGRAGAVSVTVIALVAAGVLAWLIDPGYVIWWPLPGPPELG